LDPGFLEYWATSRELYIMGTRELLILILGLAVVAVILRGLYVALHARRSQIRLAIDKNIPQDLDLEELEMSELPNGGARVIDRALDAVNQQNTVQNELDLGAQPETNEAVPILLDTVEIKNQDEMVEAENTGNSLEDEVEQLTESDAYLDEEEDVEEDIFVTRTITGGAIENDIAADNSSDDESFRNESAIERAVQESEPDLVDDDSAEYDEEAADFAVDDEARQEPELGFDEAMDEDFDDFSMSAGERIGEPEQSTAGVSRFKNKFSSTGSRDGDDKGSLFSRFNKKDSDSKADDFEPLDEQSDPLFEGYQQAPQSTEDKGAVAEVEVVEVEAAAGFEQPETARESDKNDVADINQARESRRPASSGAVTDNSSQQAEPTEVLVVNVMSREGELFQGADLLQVLITAGLKHGDMNIFHKHVDNDAQSPAIFSVANILNPGTFDLDAMEDFATRGVSLFLAMPAVISNRDGFEDMLRTAQQIRAALDGELRDDHRSVMTAQTIEHYRQRIHDFELRKLKAAQARSR